MKLAVSLIDENGFQTEHFKSASEIVEILKTWYPEFNSLETDFIRYILDLKGAYEIESADFLDCFNELNLIQYLNFSNSLPLNKGYIEILDYEIECDIDIFGGQN